MTRARPRNWHEFQHYKNRNPVWIKLHRKLLKDRGYLELPTEALAVLPLLWLHAAENVNGEFNADVDDLVFHLRRPAQELAIALRILIDRGWIELLEGQQPSLPLGVASGLLADGKQGACPETETEGETEGEKHTVRSANRFGEFWELYPAKIGKRPSELKWKQKRLDPLADIILADIRQRLRKDERWQRGVIPNPSTYLHQERWCDEGITIPKPEANTAGSSPTVVETPESKVEAVRAWCRQMHGLGRMTAEEAKAEIRAAKERHGLPVA